MPKRKSTETHHDEIQHIREDIDSLKNNVVALTKTVQHEVADSAMSRFEKVKKSSRDVVNEIEKDVKQKPLQSLATAFGAGLVLSALMRRR